ncbi:MAG: hypothetical protein SFU86_22245 [Pirellulaceae bacterium]|nr:hypothetical protein [Pirellulaceae bacterium]
MFSYTEYQCQGSYDKHGTVEINTEYVTRRKPAWLVLLKLLAVAAMVAVGYAIALPTLLKVLPLWQSIALVAGVMLIYIGLAFFFRPEPNTDNMGWFAGMGNDPTQYSDNINRSLWNLSCVLGPGRFVSESLLDACVLVGLAGGEEVVDENPPELEPSELDPVPQASEENLAIVALRSDRFE